jgi:hypothetical protein
MRTCRLHLARLSGLTSRSCKILLPAEPHGAPAGGLPE